MPASNEVLEERLQNQQDNLDRLQAKVDDLETQLREREVKNMWWGISVLGSAIGALLTILWSYRSIIFK